MRFLNYKYYLNSRANLKSQLSNKNRGYIMVKSKLSHKIKIIMIKKIKIATVISIIIRIILNKEKVYTSIIQEQSIRVISKIILNMAMENNHTQILLCISASIKMGCDLAKVDINGQMDKSMMDNGIITKNMVVDYGRD